MLKDRGELAPDYALPRVRTSGTKVTNVNEPKEDQLDRRQREAYLRSPTVLRTPLAHSSGFSPIRCSKGHAQANQQFSYRSPLEPEPPLSDVIKACITFFVSIVKVTSF